MEQQFVLKRYYEIYTDGIQQAHPVGILGEKFFIEQEKNTMDLSDLRFAQGEIYYHAHDYETAIFKWQQVQNELQLWAQKNIADSYVKQKQFSQAERLYRSIDTTDTILMMEIALQLFSLYITTEKLTEADTIIKHAVSIDPDYPEVTTTARAFFEEHQDWMSAIELAKNETIRTKSLEWFTILQSYIESDITKHLAPNYFYDSLLASHTVGHEQFEQFVTSLWNHYEDTPFYLEWLNLINEALLNIQLDTRVHWEILSNHYEAAYQALTMGNYYLRDIQPIMPDFLMNWLRIVHPSQELFAATATLAWHEKFPGQLRSYITDDANDMFNHCVSNQNGFSHAANLFEEVICWTKVQNVQLPDELPLFGAKIIGNQTGQTAELLAIIQEILIFIWNEQKKYMDMLKESVAWDEEIVDRLNGFIANLKEMEQEKAEAIIRTYADMKDELKVELRKNIPSVLKGCVDMIKEDSNFNHLHIELNKEMNHRLYSYLQERISEHFSFSAHQWVTESSEEFIEVETYLEDMCSSLNGLYQEEKLALKLDFQTLDDWHRDINRMTSRVKLGELNILLRFTPSQVLLKSAGKFLGSIVQNKSMLYTKYKNYIKTKNYEELTESVVNNLFMQFELFEGSLDRDVSMFFAESIQTLQKIVAETTEQIHINKGTLQQLQNAPEVYTDPLTLFGTRLYQYELMTESQEQTAQ